MKKTLAVLALGASGGAFAAAAPEFQGNHLDIYYSSMEFEVSGFGEKAKLDGDGGGMSFWLGNKIGLFTGEIQVNNLEDNIDGTKVDADTRLMRVGMGYRFANTPTLGAWLRAEYINFDGDIEIEGFGEASDEQDGYGIHAGLRFGQQNLYGYGEIGRVELKDLDGMEYRIGAAFQPGTLGGFIEYRLTDLELDNLPIDEEFGDLRIGIRLAY